MPSFTKRTYIIAALVLLVLILVGTFAVFKYKVKEVAIEATIVGHNPDSVPMLDTDSLTMLISDSGLIRYKLISKTWLIYDKIKDPYWLFPDKFYLEQYDSTFTVVATVEADSVWNFSKQKLWLLRGNVKINNIEDETFTSEELYWDERRGIVYSNLPVEINRPGKILLRGTGGFEANQQMTEYEFKKVQNTDLYLQEKENDETENDETMAISSDM